MQQDKQDFEPQNCKYLTYASTREVSSLEGTLVSYVEMKDNIQTTLSKY